MSEPIIWKSPEQPNASFNDAIRIVDDAWNELRRTPYVQSRLSGGACDIPDLSFEEANRRAQVGRGLLTRLDSLDCDTLPHTLALTLRLVRFRARTWSREAEWYWLVADPRGIGQFGLFLPTAYCGGYILNIALQKLRSFEFQQKADADRFLSVVLDFERLIHQFTERTSGQAKRGIRMPKVQVRQARALLASFKTEAVTTLTILPGQLGTAQSQPFMRELKQIRTHHIESAFDLAIAQLNDQYLEFAPETVGIGQYAGGADVYAELVKQHTTLELSPEEVHARGNDRMAQIERSILDIQEELGFSNNRDAFLEHLDRDPAWRASTVENITAMFDRIIKRLQPRLQAAFSTMPKAPYGVIPLPEALQASMTYGYYDAPRADRAQGFYVFNAANLARRPLFHLPAVTFHELMPGHHLQFCTQLESEALHPFSTYSFVNAYMEGWAEYAATLAGEMGLYERPEERYGRLVMDAFLTSRLVVDTGMNVLGWPLERARAYMRVHSRLVEAEIQTESVRYACDTPAQALAYKLGDTALLEMRDSMRGALGARFTLREFHDAVLAPGAVPLSDLQWHLERTTERLQRGQGKRQ